VTLVTACAYRCYLPAQSRRRPQAHPRRSPRVLDSWLRELLRGFVNSFVASNSNDNRQGMVGFGFRVLFCFPKQSAKSCLRLGVPPPRPSHHADHRILLPKWTFWQACALNTLNMFGTGPFITCAILLQTVTPAGPQALYGYFASGVLVFFDSFVWGELSSIWPYTGGSYAYLSEMYGRDTWGSLAAFMYLWQLLISGPLEVAGGFVAAASYLRYFAPMSDLGAQFAACGLSIFCFLGMYTGVRESARMTYFLWVLTMLAVLYVYVAGFSNLDASNFKSPSGWQKSLDWKTFGMLMYVCISKIQAHCLLPRS
jgi:hypothetical protein